MMCWPCNSNTIIEDNCSNFWLKSNTNDIRDFLIRHALKASTAISQSEQNNFPYHVLTATLLFKSWLNEAATFPVFSLCLCEVFMKLVVPAYWKAERLFLFWGPFLFLSFYFPACLFLLVSLSSPSVVFLPNVQLICSAAQRETWKAAANLLRWIFNRACS